MTILYRLATIIDLPEIVDIYNQAILQTTATFDTVPKTVAQQEPWFKEHDQVRNVLLVAEDKENHKIVGFGSTAAYSDRPAYAITVKLGLYIHENYRKRGIGERLVTELFSYAKTGGVHSIVSLVTTENIASIGLHRKLGFQTVGIMKQVGNKFDRLLDVVIFQKMLNE